MVDLARRHDPAEDAPGSRRAEGRVLSIHPGAQAFARTADAYERARPTYPPEAIDAIVAAASLEPGDTVVDVAAGTGKLTRLLADRGLRVIAVEPIAEMREVLARHVDAEVIAGTAESIPLIDATARVVTVAQAFHWFDPDRAPREIARVLTHDGLLAIVANVRDTENALQTALTELIAPHKGTYPNHDWPDTLPDLFDVELVTFPHEHVMDEATFVERVASISWVGALPDDERERVLRATRELAQAQLSPIRLPYVTQVFLCRRR